MSALPEHWTEERGDRRGYGYAVALRSDGVEIDYDALDGLRPYLIRDRRGHPVCGPRGRTRQFGSLAAAIAAADAALPLGGAP